MNVQKKKVQLMNLTVGATLTALVFILQMLGSFIRLGPFSISLVLVPIIIGAATCGAGMGAWLGAVFGAAVLLSGDAAAFLAVNLWGTVATVLVKGALCGLVAGLCYKVIENKNKMIAAFVSAAVCPVVNTGIFLVGCYLFFYDTVAQWGAAIGFTNVTEYMFLGLAGGNFIFELAINLLLAPAIVRVLAFAKNKLGI